MLKVAIVATVCAVVFFQTSYSYKFDQSSMSNNQTAALSMDGDQKTCSLTGYAQVNWWKVDLGAAMTISSVKINGSSGASVIQVGDESFDFGIRDGFKFNPKCVVIPTVFSGLSTYTCTRPLTGRYLSIQTADSTVTSRLQLCEVVINPTS